MQVRKQHKKKEREVRTYVRKHHTEAQVKSFYSLPILARNNVTVLSCVSVSVCVIASFER